MAISEKESEELLVNARKHIGKSYADIDCSHFVWQSFKDAGKEYPYRSTAQFDDLVSMGYFLKLDSKTTPVIGDVLMYKGHVGFWDPEGCSILVTNDVCKSLGSEASVLSSRSGKNKGPSYGKPAWFNELKAIYRWKGKNTPGFSGIH
jgi:hypothetical protein